jgi:hypothetical protein
MHLVKPQLQTFARTSWRLTGSQADGFSMTKPSKVATSSLGSWGCAHLGNGLSNIGPHPRPFPIFGAKQKGRA